MPSTEKWSSDNSGATSRCARSAAITLRDISVVSSRSRFLVKTVGTHTASSMPRPINCRSDRTDNRIWIGLAGSAAPVQSATIHAGSVLAWIAARIFGVMVACLCNEISMPEPRAGSTVP